MAVTPTPENVEQVVMLTGSDRKTAERYLRVKRNDVEAAVNAIYEGEDISKEEQGLTWDGDLHDADRDGQKREDPMNQYLRPHTQTAPGSRAPSPVGGRATLQPQNQDQEDADLAESIALSLGQTHGPTFHQESGIIGKDGTEKHFGPATKENYETNRWALVTTAQATSEVIPDADVEHRKNLPGEPRFLKHLPDGDYLPNLLTICHGIAGAREAMLMRQKVQVSYEQDADWWKGHTISMPRIVHTTSGEHVNPNQDDNDALIAEVQRLMAFLDQSERSYANVAPLAQTGAVKEKHQASGRSQTLLASFLEAYTVAADAEGDLSDRSVTNMFRTTWGMDESLPLFDITMSAADGEKSDLLELVDSMFWGAETNNTARLGLHRLADVLVLHLKSNKDSKQLGVQIPSELHMDRYLQENQEATADVRGHITDGRTRIKKITDIEKKLTNWKHPKKDAQLNPMALLKHSHKVFIEKSKLRPESDDLPNGVPANHIVPPQDQDIADKLEKVIASIDSKLTILASEKEKTRKAIAEMSRNPLPELEGHLKHRYMLRGVATKPNITYVLLPKEDEDEDQQMLLDPGDEDTPEGSQWWRIEYEVNASATGANITKIRSPGYDVLRAVELEHGSALLVYASDAANDIAQSVPSLPPPLLDFVDSDNESFRTELLQSASRLAPPAYDDGEDVRPSIERSSIDSMRAEGAGSDAGDGISPPEYGEAGFMDHPGYGLGPNIKQGAYLANDNDEPVHEINLGEPEGDATEMMEKVDHEPLIPGLGGSGGGDTAMKDAEGQDMGVGGSSYVEDMELLR